MHFVTLGPMATAKANIDAYKTALNKRGGPASPKAEFPGGAAIGVQRHIFVADTDAQAHRFAKPAMDIHLAHLNWLRVKHGETGLTSRLNVPRGANFEACVEDRTVIAGSPASVRAEIERQVRELGVNYLLTIYFWAPCRLPMRCVRSICFAARSCRIWRSCSVIIPGSPLSWRSGMTAQITSRCCRARALGPSAVRPGAAWR